MEEAYPTILEPISIFRAYGTAAIWDADVLTPVCRGGYRRRGPAERAPERGLVSSAGAARARAADGLAGARKGEADSGSALSFRKPKIKLDLVCRTPGIR